MALLWGACADEHFRNQASDDCVIGGLREMTPHAKRILMAVADSRTTTTDFKVAFYIADHVNDQTGQAWPGKVRLGGLVQVSTKTVQRSIGRLRLFDHLLVTPSRRHTNIYELVLHQSDISLPGCGRLRARLKDIGVPQTCPEPIQLNKAGNGEAAKDVPPYGGLGRWIWGKRDRLVHSSRRASYEPYLLELIGSRGAEMVARLPECVLEYLLQRVRDGSLNGTDIRAARKIFDQLPEIETTNMGGG